MSDVDRTRRSHRPSPSPSASTSNYVKPKNAAEAQKAQLDRLFSDPTKEVYIPPLPTIKGVAPPRDMIPNVQGSSAGAGSGEFHVYKQARRREYDRLKAMEEEDEKEKAVAEFEAKREAMRLADEARSAKNRAKRLKKKDKRKGKPASKVKDGPAAAEAAEAESSDSDSGEGEGRQKKRRVLASGAPGSVVFRGKDERVEDDDQPREEEVRVRRIDQAVNGDSAHETELSPAVQPQGISIVDED